MTGTGIDQTILWTVIIGLALVVGGVLGVFATNG